MSAESTNFDLPVNNDQQSVDVPLSGNTSGEFRSSGEIKFHVIAKNVYVDYVNDVEVNSKIQHSCQSECVPVCGFQRGGDKMKEGSCNDDDEEERNRLDLGIQVSEKEINGLVENRLSVKLTDQYDLLTENEPSRENYRSVKSKITHDDNNYDDFSGCGEDKKQPSDSCIHQLGKANNESQNCRPSADLPDSASLSINDGLLPKDHQHIVNTLPDTGDTINTGSSGCCTVETLLSLPNSSDCNKNVSGEKDSQPADSVSSLADENLLQREYEHNQRPLPEAGDSIDNTVYESDKVEASIPWGLHCSREARQQSINQHPSGPVSSPLSEGLIQSQCHHDPTSSPVHEDLMQSQRHHDPISSFFNEDLVQSQQHSDPNPISSPVNEDLMQSQRHSDPTSSHVNEDLMQSQRHNDSTSSPVHENLMQSQRHNDSTSSPVHEDLMQSQRHNHSTSSPVHEDLMQSQRHSDPTSSHVNEDLMQSQRHNDSTSSPVHENLMQSQRHNDSTSSPVHEDLMQSQRHNHSTSSPVHEDLVQSQRHSDPTSSPVHEDLMQSQRHSDPTSSPVHEDLMQSQRHNDYTSSTVHENLMQSQRHNDSTSSPVHEDLVQNQRHSDPTSSPVHEDLMQSQRHNDSTSSPVHEDLVQSQRHSDPTSSTVHEDLIKIECQHAQKALRYTDDEIKMDLCQRDTVVVPIPCKKEIQFLSCVHDPADSNLPVDLTADDGLSQEECQRFKHAVIHAGDNIQIPLCTSDEIPFPCSSNCNKGGNGKNDFNCNKGGNEKNDSNCKKGGNEKNDSNCKTIGDENQSLNPYDPLNISLGEDRLQNDYHSVKMKLLELKQKFDKAVYNSDTDRPLPLLTSALSDKAIKLTQEDKSLAKTDDPFDLSSEDDLYPEKYRPLKRKLCTDSKICTENSNSSSEPARMVGATEGASQAVAADAVSLKAPENKRQKTACRVAYIHSQLLLDKANELIRIQGRAELVHSLIGSFGLLQYLQVVSPRYATDTEILGFHCPEYVSFLRDSGDVPDGDDSHDRHAESYGLSYDCPIQKGIYETCALISGATIVAAETLINNAADVVINWYGGWHHAKRDTAAGFCYVNDIVLGILKLREKFDRILYVDIDLHHGDGVEEAFSMTPKVMTVSFHKYMFGFFPGTGAVADVGTGKGKYYSVNVPLLDGIKDAEFCAMFYSIMKLVREKFQPQAIVLQCGADTLSSDPMTSFNLTHLGISRCVALMLSWNLPTILLGGGGYNFPNTAKCWTFLTSLAAGRKLPLDIPEHEHLLAYGPDFEMSTTAGFRKDCNTRQHLANLVANISRNLSNI